ncbi:ATP-grasp domain-containing protein [Kitasatospora sp. NPDC048545]|uniref:ATP-grasp domain-containing protein n=1 Tax=Kitasatospora sp. NPDC048545 TaxID=3157208 RepID=UPI0033CEF34A
MPATDTPPPAFILFTDLPKAGAYLRAIAARGLRSLVVTGPPQWPLERVAVSYVGTPGHPFEAVEQLEFLRPDDTAGILDRVTSWSRDYDVRGVFNSSESFVEPAGLAADLLRLPGVGLRAAQVCRNKHLQRRYLAEWSPLSLLSSTPREELRAAVAGRYPLIAKPLDLYCSIGVQVLRNQAETDRYLDARSPDAAPVLLEQRVEGREFSVETIVVDGRPVFSGVTQKATNEQDGDFFVEMGHTVPACNASEDEAELLHATQAAVLARLGFGTGTAHGEYRILPDGRVALMEIAARPPGDGILHLYELATGASIEASAVDAALGLPVTHPQPRRPARQVYFDHLPGTLVDVTVEGPGADEPCWVVEHGLWPGVEASPADAPGGLRTVLVLKARGAELGPLTDSFGRVVTALFDAPDPEQLEQLDEDVRKAVRITVS